MRHILQLISLAIILATAGVMASISHSGSHENDVRPTATPLPLEDWSRYQNDAEGYSIQYPSAWRVETTEEMPGFSPGPTIFYSWEVDDSPWTRESGQEELPRSEIQVEISRYDNPEQLPVRDWIVALSDTALEAELMNEIEQEINGYPALWQTWSGPTGSGTITAISAESFIFYIAVAPADSEYLDDFVRMVQSFRFLADKHE